MKSRIPASYLPASLRCTLPVDDATNRIGVAFNLPDGQVLRIALDEKNAKAICTLLSPPHMGRCNLGHV